MERDEAAIVTSSPFKIELVSEKVKNQQEEERNGRRKQ